MPFRTTLLFFCLRPKQELEWPPSQIPTAIPIESEIEFCTLVSHVPTRNQPQKNPCFIRVNPWLKKLFFSLAKNAPAWSFNLVPTRLLCGRSRLLPSRSVSWVARSPRLGRCLALSTSCILLSQNPLRRYTNRHRYYARWHHFLNNHSPSINTTINVKQNQVCQISNVCTETSVRSCG